MNSAAVVFAFFCLIAVAPWRVCSEQKLTVSMTLVPNARDTDALCLDGSLPAYHLHRGFGAGQNNWLLQFEGGGWCNDLTSCLERAPTHRGSTRYMSKLEVFSGILSNNATLNPDFYNWNRVKLRYCDGASFTGDRVFNNGTTKLYFKGQKIWEAIISELLPKGLGKAKKALLSGCSAGGLATFHHCDNFTNYLPKNTSVKCLSDAGFFLDGRDISLNHTMRYFVKSLVSLQGIEQNLNKKCVNAFFFQTCSITYLCHLLLIRADTGTTAGSIQLNAHQPKLMCYKTIAEAVGDWYFSRNSSKEIDCAYPCDKTCHNLIPTPPTP